VWCELSGGVDSTTILFAAERLMREGKVLAPDLRTVSTSSTAPPARTSGLHRLAEEQLGRAGLHISEEEYPILAPHPADYLRPPVHQICYLARQDRLATRWRRTARAWC
jgi:hypothetical protein